MLISVIIPAFNEEAYLDQRLASLNRAKAALEIQTGHTAEIIVVDDAFNEERRGGAAGIKKRRDSVN